MTLKNAFGDLNLEATQLEILNELQTNGASNSDPLYVIQPQTVDAGNTTVFTDTSGSTFVGTWTQTRSLGVVRELTVLASNVTSGLGGTFTFEFGENGTDATISEPRPIVDFASVRDFDLLNAGEYYRVKFTPDRALTTGESVFITTTLRRQNDGAFVRLANQEIEELNAAMPQAFAYLKAFVEDNGKSTNIRATRRGDLFTVDRSRDTSLTGETVNSSWFPEIAASFAGSLPANVHETLNSGGIVTDFSQFQLKVTAPPGGSYLAATREQVRYTNGQETRALATTVFESAPVVGHTAILWMLSRDETSGFGIGHHDGNYVFAWRFDGVTTYTIRSDWSNDELLIDLDGSLVSVDYTTPQLNRLRMLYLGFGPLVVEARNRKVREVDPWVVMHSEHFINDSDRLMPNLSNPDLGVALEVRNTAGSGDCVVRTNSWAIGPVIGDIGEQQPNGGRTFPRADGIAVDVDRNSIVYAQTLAPGEVIESGVVDTAGHSQIEIFIETNQVSANEGVKVYYTDDANADTPHFTPPVMFNITPEDVIQGFAIFPISVNMDGFKISYQNGGLSANWRMSATLRKSPRLASQRMMTGEVEKTDPGIIIWGRDFGYNEAGVFKAPTLHDDGWKRSSIKAHETPTPIKSDNALTMSTATVGTTGSKIVDINALPANATGVQIQASNANGNAVLYLALSQANSVGGIGAGVDLASGQSQYFSVGEFLLNDIWGASSSGTVRYRLIWTRGGGV